MNSVFNIVFVLLFAFKYDLSNLEVYSFKELAKEELAYIDSEYKDSVNHYPIYLSLFYKIDKVNTQTKIKLFVCDDNYIKNTDYFKQSSNPYLGLYHPLDKAIYLPHNNIRYLSHELAHAFNYENGIFVNSKLNEEAANGFESYLIFKQ